MDDAQKLTIAKIHHIIKGIAAPGTMICSVYGLAFKKDGGTPIQIQKKEIAGARFMMVGRGWQFQLTLNNGSTDTYDNFTNAQKEQAAAFFSKHYAITPKISEVNVQGWNWGKFNVDANNAAFTVDGKTAFEIPLSQILNAQSVSKHEATLECVTEGLDVQDHSIESVRFHFTAQSDDEEQEDERRQAEIWVQKILDVTQRTESQAKSIATIPMIMSMIHRSKYDFEFLPDYVRMRSKAFEFKIQYSQVRRLFKLAQPDRTADFFVLQLDPPLTHNLKKHHLITLLIPQGDEIDNLPINRTDNPDVIAKLNQENVAEEEKGPVIEVFAILLKALSGSKIYVPGKDYRTKHDNYGLKCTYKGSVEGYLYPMAKAFLFVFKSPSYIPYKDVQAVHFERINDRHSVNRSFDLLIVKNDGTEYKFSSIPKEEHPLLRDYIQKMKGIEIVGDDSAGTGPSRFADDDSDDDTYMNRMKAEGKAVEGGSDDESSDGSYQAKSSSSGSGDEEFDSDSSALSENDGGSDDSQQAEKKKKKAQKQAKKQKKRKKSPTSDDNDGSDSDAASNPKPKRAISAYMYYIQGQKNVPLGEGEKSSDRMKIIATQWKELSEDDRKEWDDKASEDKERYGKEMAIYEEENGGKRKPTKKKGKRRKEGEPKRPQSSFFLFSSKMRAQVKIDFPELSVSETAKKMGEMWKEVTEEEKIPYQEEFEANKLIYAKEMEEFKLKQIAEGGDDDDIPEKSKKSSKRGKKIRFDGEPKNPLSSYLIFAQSIREKLKEENPELKMTEMSKVIGTKWSEIKDEEKQKYVDEAAKLKAQYESDMLEFKAALKEKGIDYDNGPKGGSPNKRKKTGEAGAKKKKGKTAVTTQIKGQSTLKIKSKDTVDSDDNVDTDESDD
eukprot:m.151423 g.151423  ORF g.151423 m.151423 type:complete len:891 (-) comp30759_c4_seq2:2534-5206(-)